jgi:hypothetical protein
MTLDHRVSATTAALPGVRLLKGIVKTAKDRTARRLRKYLGPTQGEPSSATLCTMLADCLLEASKVHRDSSASERLRRQRRWRES